MSLKYKILWVDDDVEAFEDLEYPTRIQNYLSNLFFEPIIQTYDTIKEAKKDIAKEKYDLILSDYNIDNEKGDDFIRFIREQHVSTEILFYSAQSEFITAAHELLQDRISFACINSPTGEGYKILYDKILDLINYTIKKVQELPNIRGLVMTETTYLDKLMSDLILKYIKQATPSQIIDIQTKLFKHMSKSIKGNLNKIDCKNSCSLKIEKRTMEEIVKMRIFESSKKAYTIKLLIEAEKLKTETKKDFYTDYVEDIINNRNNLAHAYSEYQNGKEVLVTENPDEIIIFDAEKCAHIRSNIICYKRMLESLFQQLNL